MRAIDESTQAPLAPAALQLRLTRFNRGRLLPARPDEVDPLARIEDELVMRQLEAIWLEQERAAVARRAAAAPTDARAFLAWFEQLKEQGPGQGDPLFPWLAARAGAEAMTWFLTQEVAGEAGFDDLVALTQLRMPKRAKLELARNYWDEMGNGKAVGMHGPMLEALVQELDLDPDPERVCWEALAVGNLLAGLAFDRRFAYHAVGALGAVELTAPGRTAQVERGLRRLGISPAGRRYFQVHAVLDVKHAEAWNREVIEPLVRSDPRNARPIAEGALMRLRAGARCFERYREVLGV
ncbi:iron-containing redox enzyme family protein [Vulgatibacter sp.]|uniref:iron-containing redox enzyme family protein n=1 Tax=Vulgatibacter sp. TaxID=1971226 RepID=UPI00356761F3